MESENKSRSTETPFDALAKCPFCKNTELILSDTDCGDNVQEFAHIVVCGDCGARGPWGKTEEEAKSLWDMSDEDRNIVLKPESEGDQP